MTAPSRAILPHTDAHPAIPGYSSMRLVADWASAVRGEPLYFGFDGAHATLGPESGAGTLPLYTRPFIPRPRVTRVQFTVTHRGVSSTLVLDGGETSALFWSESSVEKFLFPYLASAAAGTAPSLLRQLAHAWYGYAADEVQVCAVAYECGPARPARRKRLTLEGMVALVCLVDGKLEKVPLQEFRKRFPRRGRGPRVEQEAGLLRRESGWPLNGQVGNIVARDAAEFVSGLRGHEVVFQVSGGELDPWVADGGREGGMGRGNGFECGMDFVRADRPAPSGVVMYVRDSHGTEHARPLDESGHAVMPDSVFWSDGAVEKLLVPYYASVKGLAAPLFTALLLGKWNGLVRGEPPLETLFGALAKLQDFLGAPAASLFPDGALTEDDPYAVTHLPRSEYIPEPEAGTTAPEARTHFLRLGAASEPLGSVSA